ncbi:hypothetical protein [Nocardioides sp. AE5]|nr:hypothetical protein [Nocardioides sp. AE5]MDT0202825.1 hypothetical protein [Nocardioides sp. AE5]
MKAFVPAGLVGLLAGILLSGLALLGVGQPSRCRWHPARWCP